MIDDCAHRQWWLGHEALDEASGDAADAVGLSSVVAEGELVEIGLQMLRRHRPRMRAQEPALRERRHPVTALHCIVFAPLLLGLHMCQMRAPAEALPAVARVSVSDNARFSCDLFVGEAFARLRVIVVGVDETHAYQAETVNLPAGGRMMVVSDGIIEQPGLVQKGEQVEEAQFDMAGVIDTLQSAGDDAVADLFAAVIQHAGTESLADDATAVLVRW